MHSPDPSRKPADGGEAPAPDERSEAPRAEPVPVVPAPALCDSDYDWDPERDPAEGLDPATTWWGG